MFFDMEKNGHPPGVYTFGSLIHGFSQIRNTLKVIEFLQKMENRQIQLNDATDFMVRTQLLKEEKCQEYLKLLPTFLNG